MDKGCEVNVTNPAKAGLNTVKSSEFHFCIPVKFFSLSQFSTKQKLASQQKFVVAQNRKLRPEAAHSKHIAIEAFVPYLISIYIKFSRLVKCIAQNRLEVISVGIRTGHGLS